MLYDHMKWYNDILEFYSKNMISCRRQHYLLQFYLYNREKDLKKQIMTYLILEIYIRFYILVWMKEAKLWGSWTLNFSSFTILLFEKTEFKNSKKQNFDQEQNYIQSTIKIYCEAQISLHKDISKHYLVLVLCF